MKLPEQYKNLTLEQKKNVISNLISQFWNEKIQWLSDHLWDSQIEFLFSYFFTESKEERDRMWNDMQKKYESALQEIEHIAQQIQLMNLKYKELLDTKADLDDLQSIDEKINSM